MRTCAVAYASFGATHNCVVSCLSGERRTGCAEALGAGFSFGSFQHFARSYGGRSCQVVNVAALLGVNIGTHTAYAFCLTPPS